MTMLIINAIEVSYQSKADYSIDEETTNVRLIAEAALPQREKDSKKQYAVSGLIRAYCCQLRELQEEYGDYLEVEEEEQAFAK
jgi:uncharacterized protein YsxB (DUF464 family)